MQKFPELKNSQVALLRTNSQTGLVLDEMLNLVTNDEQKVYTIFNSYYEALESAKSIMSKEENNIECVIYGKNQEVLFTLTPEVRKSFSDDFCVHLEYHLCNALANSPDNEIKQLWCDGVRMPDDLLTMKSVIEKKKIVTTAWIGIDGGEIYEMILKLGENSLDNFRKGLSLIDCLPDAESLDWIIIDTNKKTIELQLI
jgi:hypothetical protein